MVKLGGGGSVFFIFFCSLTSDFPRKELYVHLLSSMNITVTFYATPQFFRYLIKPISLHHKDPRGTILAPFSEMRRRSADLRFVLGRPGTVYRVAGSQPQYQATLTHCLRQSQPSCCVANFSNVFPSLTESSTPHASKAIVNQEF